MKVFLPKLRLIIFSFAFVHLVIVLLILLSIDLTISQIPELRAYDRLKWKLITTWFNLTMLAYFPLCIWCDWWEINNEAKGTAWRRLNKIRDVVFTSILLPTTTFADLLFWRIYNKNEEFLLPRGSEDEIPYWSHHSLHTVSLVVVLLDLALTPRRRPESLMPGLAVTLTFWSCYSAVCWHCYLQGENVYRFFRILGSTKVAIFTIYTYVEHCAFYFSQWFVIDFLWNQKNLKQREIKRYYEMRKKNNYKIPFEMCSGEITLSTAF